MNITDFKKLSKVGDEGEQKFVEFLKQKGFTNIKHVDETDADKADWDIQATNHEGTFTFEVKNQPNCHEFGSVNIELIQNRAFGGLSTSKSDFFVFVNPTLGFGFAHTEELRECGRAIFEKKGKFVKEDFQNKETYRINNENIKLWATSFDNPAFGFRYQNDWLTWKN